MMKMINEFKAFALRGNVVDMAVGIVIGAAFTSIVTSLVNDIIMPPIGLLLGGVDFTNLKWVLKDAAAGDPTTEVAIRWGSFVNAIIAFLVIAFVVWQISKMFLKPEPEAEVKTCPFCKEANAVGATKCKACASSI